MVQRVATKACFQIWRMGLLDIFLDNIHQGHTLLHMDTLKHLVHILHRDILHRGTHHLGIHRPVDINHMVTLLLVIHLLVIHLLVIHQLATLHHLLLRITVCINTANISSADCVVYFREALVTSLVLHHSYEFYKPIPCWFIYCNLKYLHFQPTAVISLSDAINVTSQIPNIFSNISFYMLVTQ